MSEIDAYHVNNEKKCSDFLSSQESHLIVSNDTIYLGSGMYFWDNIGNAHYWKRMREKNSRDVFLVLQCVLDIDALLDLTDPEISSKIDHLWDMFEKKSKSGHKKPLKNLAGKLDYLYEACTTIKCFHVIRIIAEYDHKINDANIFCGKNYIAQNVRVIYCVKNNCAIKDKKLLA
ncbi:hypothetical protein [Pectinatus frisingensis]|uniref:hypothetical protein n=1 Tax=Pectinatus frisingensis TaxID=865 RepID=UPI0018C688D0|nr:hypothetical protein [Pectinatus frisingensis]